MDIPSPLKTSDETGATLTTKMATHRQEKNPSSPTHHLDALHPPSPSLNDASDIHTNDLERTRFSPSCSVDADGDDSTARITSPSFAKNMTGGRKLILIFSQERTGSNLLTELLKHLNTVTRPSDLDLISLGELFSTGGWHLGTIKNVLPVMGSICRHHDPTKNKKMWYEEMMQLRGKSRPDDWTELQHFLNQSSSSSSASLWTRELLECTLQNTKDPQRLLSFLRGIPSTSSEKSYVSFKVFRGHYQDSAMQLESARQFLDLIHNVWPDEPSDNIMIIVLWRRRVLESFVSEEIANQKTKRYAIHATNASHAITIDKRRLEFYLARWFRYFRDVRRSLLLAQSSFVNQYHVLEYGHDLQDKTKQEQTYQHVLDWLGIPRARLLSQNLNTGMYKKQAQVPVEQQVQNYDQVQSWGYFPPAIRDADYGAAREQQGQHDAPFSSSSLWEQVFDDVDGHFDWVDLWWEANKDNLPFRNKKT